MASASFRSVGHIRPALWSRGCYCKHDWPQADVLGCQIYRFLAPPCRCSRSDTSAPSADTPHPTSYTRGWQTLPAVVPLVPTVGSRLFNFPGPQAVPLEARCTQENAGRSDCCHGLNFRGSNAFFQKHIWAILKGPCSFVSQVYGGGPKK